MKITLITFMLLFLSVTGCSLSEEGNNNSSPVNDSNETDGFNGSVDPVPSEEVFFDRCEDLEGVALPEYGECEQITKDQCDELRGNFDGCTSSCRNQEDYPNVTCIQVCVPVCSFNASGDN